VLVAGAQRSQLLLEALAAAAEHRAAEPVGGFNRLGFLSKLTTGGVSAQTANHLHLSS